MKIHLLLFCLLSLVLVVFAWDKDDYEIFDLVSALETAEGKGTNFYSHLNIDSSASIGEINKAYRKKSLELHPDKNPGVKDIQERFARLGVISQILRSPEKRERYNFFYKNGVPKWRGTGYYYSRYRPTLAHTLLFLVFLSSLFHRLILHLNYSKDKRRVEYFQQSALGVVKNGGGKREKFEDEIGRRVKVSMVEGNDFAGWLDLVVLGEHVYIPHDDGSLEPLEGLASPPSFLKTWPVRLALLSTRRLVAVFPPSVQSRFPASLQPIPVLEMEEQQEEEVVDTRKSRKNKSRTSTPRETPRDTPVSTDMEDDDDVANGTGEETADADGKKKKRGGVGKAGGARRRKMAMKK